MAGVLHHIVACTEAGIKPIVGVEAYYRPNRLIHNNDNKRTYHMVLLAKNEKGWRNLMRLTSESYTPDSFYYKPTVDFELLSRYSEGIVMSTACLGSFSSACISKGDDLALKAYFDDCDKIFGEDWHVEIMPNSMAIQATLNIELDRLASERGRSVITTVDAHYPYKEWADTQDVVLMMATGQSVAKRKAKKEAGEDVYEFGEKSLYLMSEAEVEQAFADNHPFMPEYKIRQAIDNTQRLADSIEQFEPDKSVKMPKLRGGVDPERLVRGWAEEGMQAIESRYALHGRGAEWDAGLYARYRTQLEYEMDVLRELGVFDYIAIVGGMVRWAKERMRVGAGRGSASGSLVSFCIGMTGVDPIGHGLMFERFINPHRREMPDVDSDFPRESRQSVKDWLSDELGDDCVADIVAFQTFAPKMALSGVARVFDVPYERTQECMKVMDGVDSSMTLRGILDSYPELQRFKQDFPDVWKHADRISDPPMVKSLSQHPGGVVITDTPVSEHMPTMRGNKSATVTAWGARTEFNVIDRYGFVKIDVLGIVDLDKQAYAIDWIKRRTGVTIDLNELPACFWPEAIEPEIMQRFADGDTFGVFQFEASQITQFLKQIKPDWLGDVVAANALWRPGPIGSGDAFKYAPRKNGDIKWEHWHSSVAPILDETHGLVAYQEQVIRIVQELGGFSLAEGDIVRKSITKNYKTTGAADLLVFKEKFITNALKRVATGVPEVIWDNLMSSTTYSFNKCISGDTIVLRGSGGGRARVKQAITVAELYDAWQSDTQWGHKLRTRGLTLLQMDDDGRIRPGRVKSVYDNGVREVLEIVTESGRSIKVTANHRLLTDRGYIEAGQLEIGSQLVCMGKYPPVYVKRGISHHAENSPELVVGGHGASNKGYIDGRCVAFVSARDVVRSRAQARCEKCGKRDDGKKHTLELAHTRTLEQCAGEYQRYNSSDNMRLLCNSCHKSFDYLNGQRAKRYARGRPTTLDCIVSIVALVPERVYDVEMDTAGHNFVANEIVSHNSHSSGYAVMAYQDQWLKVHYPIEFYAAQMTFDEKRVPRAVREAQAAGVKMLPPDINNSDESFTPDGDAIRFGLAAVANVGQKAVEAIKRYRPFADFADFLDRVPKRECNKRVQQSLINCGAFDSFGMRDFMDRDAKARLERETIGYSLSSNPVSQHRELIASRIMTPAKFDATPCKPKHKRGCECDECMLSECTVGGEVVDVKKRVTKKGDPYAFIEVAFGSDVYACTLWRESLELFEHLFERVVLIRGFKDARGQLVVSYVCDIEDLAAQLKEVT